MASDIWQRAIDFALEHAPQNQIVKFEFGVGETFLRFNEFQRLLDYLQMHAEKKNISTECLVSTNGVLLDEKKLECLASRGVSLAFSIDGPEEIHDRYRMDRFGKGSFKSALNNWKFYKELSSKASSKPGCNVQSVFTGDLPLKDLADFWISQGQDVFSCMIQMPGFQKDAASIYNWKKRQAQYLDELLDWAMRLASRLDVPGFLSGYKGPEDLYFMWVRQFLDQELHACGAGENIAAIDINGDIYPCELFIGSKRWRIGNIFEGFSADRMESFRRNRVEAISICDDCQFKKICSKSCLASNPDGEIKDNFEKGCFFAKELIKVGMQSFDLLSKIKRCS